MLNAGDDVVGLEQLEEDSDGKALVKARRFTGSMSALSGASGVVYMEYKYSPNPLCIILVLFLLLVMIAFQKLN